MKPTRIQMGLCACALAALAVLLAVPGLLRDRVASGLAALAGADHRWLAIAALLFLVAFGCTVAAWRAALAAAGGRICPRQAAARLAVGSMVNAFAPAKLGDAVKVGLCSRAIEGPARLWTAGGVYAALAAARSLALACLLVVASATGALPLWPVFVLVAGVVALGLVAASSGRWRRHPRLASLLAGFASLERSPRAVAAVLGWTFGMLGMRLAATTAVAAALGLPHPVLAALVIMPALDVAGALPLTPGNVGIGSGAVAVVLASRGIGASQALGVAFALQGVETLVGVGTGVVGLALLAQPSPRTRGVLVRASVVGASAALAAAVGLLVLNLI